jgi:enediyne biosynthesis protein E4
MNKKTWAIAALLALFGIGAYFLVASYFTKEKKADKVTIFGEQFSSSPFSLDGISYQQQVLSPDHTFTKGEMSPLIGSALLDINGDGTEEVFIGGGYGQNDTWYRYVQNKFVDITAELGWNNTAKQATYGTAVVDYDNDGDGDIFVARVDGVFYYENHEGKRFGGEKKIEVFLEETAVPTGITLGDINSDGQVDMFVSTYLRHDKIEGATIFNREEHGTVSKILLGKGNLLFEDGTQKLGLEYRHNTFAGSLVDIDNDADLDLVVAYDTGAVRIYQNNSKENFSLLSGTPWENKYGYPMGIGVGDINNDGLTDFFFSNTGKSLPEFALRGDLRKDQELFTGWTLYQNNGGGIFKEQSSSIDLAKHEFAWGGVLTDINLDGREDLIVSENYVKIPQQRINPLPGRVFFQNESGTFIPSEKILAIENPQFSLSSLVSDWNQDGIQDILWVNIDGASQVYISQVQSPAKPKRIEVPYEARFLGSKWTVTFDNGKSIYWTFVPAEGLGSTQSRNWLLPRTEAKIKDVSVIFSDGSTQDGSQYQK